MTRMLVARLLVVLVGILAVLSLLAGYIRYQALDNETFTETAADLIANDVIRDQVALTLVEELYANVDVAAALEDRLPAGQQGLAGPIAGVARELADRAAVRVLERPRAQEVWVRSLSTTHEQLLRVLDDELTAVSTDGGALVLNLQPLVIQLGDRVAIFGRLAERLPGDAGRVEIMKAEQLEQAQDVTQLLKILGRFLWLITLALAALAIWLAGERRRSIVRSLAIAGDRRGPARPGRPWRRRRLRRRQPRADGVGETCGRGDVGHSHRTARGRWPDTRRDRARTARRRVARRPVAEGDCRPNPAGSLARAVRDRVRRRCGRAGAARLVGADGADAPLAARAGARRDARARRGCAPASRTSRSDARRTGAGASRARGAGRDVSAPISPRTGEVRSHRPIGRSASVPT